MMKRGKKIWARTRLLVLAGLVAFTVPATGPWMAGNKAEAAPVFTHSGILYEQSDFDRAKTNIASGTSPWIEAWETGKQNKYASSTYNPSPVAAPARYGDSSKNVGNQQLFDDATAALTQAIIWKVSNNATEAAAAKAKADQILDAWSETVNKAVGGDENQLLAGLTAYKLAAAADIMRADSAWVNSGKLTAAKNMLRNYFYPPLKTFLANHQGKNNGTAYPYYYRGNQDQAAMVSIMAIGILCDDIAIYNEAVSAFKSGKFNGNINNYLKVSSDAMLAQSEESGRDQPHSQLGLGLLATMAQMSYVQKKGDASFEDLYEYSNRLILKGFEYTAKYNLGQSVPFAPVYTSTNNSWGRVESAVSTSGRSQIRPVYSMVWNHYKYVKGLADSAATDPVYYTRSMNAAIWPESVHTDHQPFSSLMYSRISRPANSLSHTVSFNVKETTSYITAPSGGTSPLLANATLSYFKSASNAEKFLVTYAGSGMWTLKSLANNLYVSVSSTTDPLKAKDASVIGNQNKFIFVDQGNGGIGIKSVQTGKFVQIKASTGQLLADESSITSSANDKFRLMYH
ncbi:RICIN domain-containing protein [Paenibacillus sp. YN15]|uniref:fascin domain-containing protein n=1 Tax=Paenibacillus sp. YN15 TaxID=1742774 RepID=UPI0011BFCE85|nr:RICIN domain-containing protein [Paenibacillus sp. YN15]